MRDGLLSGEVRDDDGGCGVSGGSYSDIDGVRAVKPGRPVFETGAMFWISREL